VSKSTDAKQKSQLGQFFTPASTARFMARLFEPSANKACRLLDAGAGVGSLSSAFLERAASGGLTFKSVDVTAFELDTRLHEDLRNALGLFSDRLDLTYQIVANDFIEEALNRTQFAFGDNFTHAILNPP
jgi:adenine-specific DNA-methyltransferase